MGVDAGNRIETNEVCLFLRTLHYVLYNNFYYKSIPFFKKMLE